MRRYWLSIDFDFFCREAFGWDWGHRETPFFRDSVWPLRALGLKAVGVDFMKETDLRHADISPTLFWEWLKANRLDFGKATLVVSDSHMYAYETFTRTRAKPDTTMLHFDAHHDLGYADFDNHYAKQRADCGSWLWFVMQYQRDLKLRVIFPKWKGAADLGPLREKWWFKRISRRVRRQVGISRLEPGVVERIHLCRSGSWSPPWHDEAWLAMVDEGRGVCPAFQQPYRKQEGVDVLVKREWDVTVLQEALKSELLLRERMRKRVAK